MTVHAELFELNASIFIQIINTMLLVILVTLPVAAAILLQIHLCKKENKWYGIILPISSGLFSLATVFSIVAYMTSTQTNSGILLCLLYFMFINIPTLIFLLIYRSCRKKYRIKKEMNKMNIQDLN